MVRVVWGVCVVCVGCVFLVWGMGMWVCLGMGVSVGRGVRVYMGMVCVCVRVTMMITARINLPEPTSAAIFPQNLNYL